MNDRSIRLIELFAGIGSQAMALRNLGLDYEIVAISEFDKYASSVHEAIHGKTRNLGDIKEIDILPECDLLTYSFPCQDLSISGTRKGMSRKSGTRSGLLWEVERLLNTYIDRGIDLPKHLLMENVSSITYKQNIDDFNMWIDTLSEMGYSSSYEILDAKDYGVPQSRRRCFMVSSLDDMILTFPNKTPSDRVLKDILEYDVPTTYHISEVRFQGLERHREEQDMKGNNFGYKVTDPNSYANALTTAEGQRNICTFIPWSESKTGIRRLTSRECWRLQGFDDEDYDKAKEVVSETQLIKQAGNSIAVPCLEAIFKAMFIDRTWYRAVRLF